MSATCFIQIDPNWKSWTGLQQVNEKKKVVVHRMEYILCIHITAMKIQYTDPNNLQEFPKSEVPKY
jgi:hypothetical protein